MEWKEAELIESTAETVYSWLGMTCKKQLYLGLLFCLFLGFLLLVLAAGRVIISAGKSWAARGLTAARGLMAALYFFLILLSVCLLGNDKQFKANSVQNNCQKNFNDYLVGNRQGKIQKHLSDDGNLCAQSGSVLVSAWDWAAGYLHLLSWVRTVWHCWHIMVLVISPPKTWSTKFLGIPFLS